MSVVVVRGDARALPLPDRTVDAIVCDPPYALGFMGSEWDSFGDTGRGARVRAERATELTPTGKGHSTSAGPYLAAGVDSLRSAGRPFQAWCEQWAAEALRVAKPGAHMLAFGGTRTHHRLACAVEDAGWEIRDSIGLLGWVQGQGFPKSLDVSKAIDLHLRPAGNGSGGTAALTAPATEDAIRWQGFGTALKPAWEPIILARKPLEGVVAANTLRYGTGALNVDGCRVPHVGADDLRESTAKNRHADFGSGPRENRVYGVDLRDRGANGNYDGAAGRWPPNLALVHHPDCAERCAPGCHIAEMDRQSGVTQAGCPRVDRGRGGIWSASADGIPAGAQYGDTGGASRYFPTFRFEAKAGTAERPVVVRDEAGDHRSGGNFAGGIRECRQCRNRTKPGSWVPGDTRPWPPCGHNDWEWGMPREHGGLIAHPTVKPVDLIRWLARLITPPGGLVLDQFAGSGTTGQAARLEGFRSVLVEQDPDYCALIRERLSWPVRVGRDGRFERLRPEPVPEGQRSLFDLLDGPKAAG